MAKRREAMASKRYRRIHKLYSFWRRKKAKCTMPKPLLYSHLSTRTVLFLFDFGAANF